MQRKKVGVVKKFIFGYKNQRTDKEEIDVYNSCLVLGLWYDIWSLNLFLVLGRKFMSISEHFLRLLFLLSMSHYYDCAVSAVIPLSFVSGLYSPNF